MGGKRHPLPTVRSTLGKKPVAHCTGSWVQLGTGLDGSGNFLLNGVRIPDRQARSDLLYRAHLHIVADITKIVMRMPCSCNLPWKDS